MSQHTGRRTWCKICGITAAADADAAQSAGADAIGLNCFRESPRYIDTPRLADIAACVRITRVALFVDPEPRAVDKVLAAADIDVLQFSGDEDEAFCAGFGLPFIKTLRMADNVEVTEYADRYQSAWAIILDAFHPQLRGGTGLQFDWRRWPNLPDKRLILAGGLTPENVGAAIEMLHPFGVDVSGGVEGPVKGCKDHDKVARFIHECRSIE